MTPHLWFPWHLILCLLLLLGVNKVEGNPYVAVVADPNTVQTQDSKLIFSFVLGKKVAAGGFVKMKFPSQMTVSTSVTGCEEVDGDISFTSCTADTSKNTITFELGNDIDLVPGEVTSRAYQFIALSAINLPNTIQIAEPVLLQTSAGEVLDTTFKASVGSLAAVSLTPADNTVGKDTTL